MSVTQKDIAKRLGISSMTVSRALNNQPNVNEKTRNLVLQTAVKLKYLPNLIAKSLKSEKTNTLGVVITDIKNPFFADIVGGIEKVAKEHNYGLLLSNTDYDLDAENRLIYMLLEKRVDGLLICPLQKKSDRLTFLRSSKIPFVVMNYSINLRNCNYVISDNVYGAFLVVDHLIKRGYKEIYYICKTTNSPTRENRIKGCEKAFKKHGLPLNKLKIIYCNTKIKSFYEITKEKIKFKGNRI
ncbi:unnamed protein product, partial [marine sediment metagenome]